MNKTNIQWTEKTWNPTRGCTVVGPECANCYAREFAERFKGTKGHPYENGFDFGVVPHKLVEPLLITKPSMVFVNSMSDLFHKNAPVEYIQKVAWVMSAANWHIFQVLTKRPDKMSKLLEKDLADAAECQHIWWGVSVGNKKGGVPRIEVLRNSKAKVKWLSIEPLLEDLGEIDLSGIDWVVVGGESGPKFREMKKEWVESIQAQCAAAKVPFFFKQWSGLHPKKLGRELNNVTYDEMPRIITGPVIDETERQRRLAVVAKWIEEMNGAVQPTGK